MVILGDSITAGYGLDPANAYPAILQKKAEAAQLPCTIVNAGVSGDTTAGGLRRVSWALAKGADVLVIALGGNDGLRGIPPAQSEKNLVGIIAKAREKNPEIRIIIAGMRMPDNMGAAYIGEFREVFPRVAQREKTALVPYLLEGVGGNDALNQPDRIHPTRRGQERVAENVWPILAAELRLMEHQD